jgi:hypothetical protein
MQVPLQILNIKGREMGFSATDTHKFYWATGSLSSVLDNAPTYVVFYNTGKAVCGAAGCTRACMISLEKRGVLKNKFESPFRTEKPWKIDWSQEAIEVDYKAQYEGLNSPNAKVKDKSDTD